MKLAKYLLYLGIFFIFLLFNALPVGAQSVDLFISEYVEGSSNNKALEIYNPTESSINLNSYKLQSYVNGGMAPNYTYIFPIDSLLEPNMTFVVCNSNSTSELLSKCNATASGVFTFNGDDTIVLSKDSGILVDVIGQIGFDPGTEWGNGLISTQDSTLQRKCSVYLGDTVGLNVFDPNSEWNGSATDMFDGLGSHLLCLQTPIPQSTIAPTDSPIPSSSPTIQPTIIPTEEPTEIPIPTPTLIPTEKPMPTAEAVTPSPTSTPKSDHHKNDHWINKFIEVCRKFIYRYDEKLHEGDRGNFKMWPWAVRFTYYNKYR